MRLKFVILSIVLTAQSVLAEDYKISSNVPLDITRETAEFNEIYNEFLRQADPKNAYEGQSYIESWHLPPTHSLAGAASTFLSKLNELVKKSSEGMGHAEVCSIMAKLNTYPVENGNYEAENCRYLSVEALLDRLFPRPYSGVERQFNTQEGQWLRARTPYFLAWIKARKEILNIGKKMPQARTTEGLENKAIARFKARTGQLPEGVIDVGTSSGGTSYRRAFDLTEVVKKELELTGREEFPKTVRGIDTDKAFETLELWLQDKNLAGISISYGQTPLYNLKVFNALVEENSKSLKAVINDGWFQMPLDTSSVWAIRELSIKIGKQNILNHAFVTPAGVYIKPESYPQYMEIWRANKAAMIGDQISEKIDRLRADLRQGMNQLNASIGALVQEVARGNSELNHMNSQLAEMNSSMRSLNYAAWTSVVLSGLSLLK